MKRKRLYIIAGVTGALGNALLAKLLQDETSVVYGLSRQALPWGSFVDARTGKLLPKTFVCSIGGEGSVQNFVDSINGKHFASVTYIHAIGHFPFEINEQGESVVENDMDGDGINDTTHQLSYVRFKNFMDALQVCRANTKVSIAGCIFGSIADVHEPLVHQSWWRTMQRVKEYMQTSSAECGMHVVNISSLLCAREILTRPFVFAATNSDARYWLQPAELAELLHAQFQSPKYYSGFDERNVYNHNPRFKQNYYSEIGRFTKRKMLELYGRSQN